MLIKLSRYLKMGGERGMKRLNIDLVDKNTEEVDPVVELIYESMELWEENLKLFLENERLKERVEDLEKIKGRYEEFWMILRG
jgi:regulator of replication initiation timing